MASPTLEAAIGGDLEETTSTTPDMVHQLVRRARGAQAVFEQFPQERVDAIVRDFAKYVYDNAELVAGMAHKETGLSPASRSWRKDRRSSKNSKANRIETGERSGGIGEICSVEVDEK
jgi:acyl-CoA reductase-like NAD-dependent aldehyde dehydrogenase